tara:strand:- start:1007 stop:1168 length:162 start_codon:yes stop_codon:yes gene_type:complete
LAKFKAAPNKTVMGESGIMFFDDKGCYETEKKADIETLKKCQDVKALSVKDSK